MTDKPQLEKEDLGSEGGVLNQIVCNVIRCRAKIFPCIATVFFSNYFPFSNEHDKVFKIF